MSLKSNRPEVILCQERIVEGHGPLLQGLQLLLVHLETAHRYSLVIVNFQKTILLKDRTRDRTQGNVQQKNIGCHHRYDKLFLIRFQKCTYL